MRSLGILIHSAPRSFGIQLKKLQHLIGEKSSLGNLIHEALKPINSDIRECPAKWPMQITLQ